MIRQLFDSYYQMSIFKARPLEFCKCWAALRMRQRSGMWNFFTERINWSPWDPFLPREKTTGQAYCQTDTDTLQLMRTSDILIELTVLARWHRGNREELRQRPQFSILVMDWSKHATKMEQMLPLQTLFFFKRIAPVLQSSYEDTKMAGKSGH